MSRLLLCAMLGMMGMVCAADDPPVPKAESKKRTQPKYEMKADHDPNGIGKFYMGREIAHVMGFEGAKWLERPERVKEEEPTKLIKALEFKPGMVVADIGAGSVYYSFRLAPLVGQKGKIIACDIQQEMLDIIADKAKKKKVTNIEPVKGTETDPKLPIGGVDLILMVDVYHEFSQPFEMAEKMVDALKPGGRLVFVEFRLEDEKVPILLVHKMSERQVIKEMEPFPEMQHTKTIETLPWQHVIVFTKKEEKKVEPQETKPGKPSSPAPLAPTLTSQPPLPGG
jgi:ubiquinone/menaquinone biosynthesis C-methylase UbiE